MPEDLTGQLARYVAGALERPLPEEAAEQTRLHLLDTLAAIVSGSTLAPGRKAIAYVRAEGTANQATVIGGGFSATAGDAAFANGMSAHADETDDSNQPAHVHPGCGIIPAALAVAEREGSGGQALLRAIALGYDAGCRVAIAVGGDSARAIVNGPTTHAVGSTFGAAAAAGALCRLSERQCRWLLSYAAQQAWGLKSFLRDPNHVEKAFVLGGRPARAGVLAATLVQRGFDAVADVFDGEVNYLDTVWPGSDRGALTDALGERWEVQRTNIKRYPVGSPIQAVVEALRRIHAAAPLDPAQIEGIDVHLPPLMVRTVDRRDMADINAQYVAAVFVLDGGLSYASVHDGERVHAADVQAMMGRVKLTPDPGMAEIRQARVEVRLRDARQLAEHVTGVRGTAQNPMPRSEVSDKALELIGPVAGPEAARQLVEAVLAIDELADVRRLTPLLSFSPV